MVRTPSTLSRSRSTSLSTCTDPGRYARKTWKEEEEEDEYKLPTTKNALINSVNLISTFTDPEQVDDDGVFDHQKVFPGPLGSHLVLEFAVILRSQLGLDADLSEARRSLILMRST